MPATLVRPEGRKRTSGGERLRFVGAASRRRPMVAVSSLALVMLCIAVFTSLYVRAGRQTAVLAVARDVPQGHRIRSDDLAVVRLSFSSALSPVPASQGAKIVGRRAAVPLVAGTLLEITELVGRNAIPTGDAVVGVAVQQGQLPAAGVSPGDLVDVVFTGSPGAPETGGAGGIALSGSSGTSTDTVSTLAGGIIAQGVTVSAVNTSSSTNSDTIVVSVVVPSVMAPLVANASAARQAAIVIVGPGS